MRTLQLSSPTSTLLPVSTTALHSLSSADIAVYVGAVQSGIAAVTGSAGDQANADQSKAKATAERDASHAAVKAGPYTLSSSGVPAKQSADRSQGAWDQTIGSGKETIGNLIGSEDLKRQGREQNASGQAQEAKGQLSDFGSGIGDRVSGAVGSAVAGLTGDREGQQKYADQHDEGKSRQRGAEIDINKQA
jgi:uncharacterized protein YjbJ (UPF0337 family)